MASAVIQAEQRVKCVHIEGLALLKIVKHCHESLPAMVTGSLLGLTSPDGILEVTHSFPFPDPPKNSNAASNDGDNDGDGTAMLDGHEFQLEMMRMLREVNVDNNCVGWYQSMYLGLYSTNNLLENQLSYQTDLSPNAVVVLYDPLQTAHGELVLKCFRLSDAYLKLRTTTTTTTQGGTATNTTTTTTTEAKNAFVRPRDIFERVPVKLTNPGLVRALLLDLSSHTSATGVPRSMGTVGPNAAAVLADEGGLYEMGADTSLDRLDLSFNPYLEKHLEFLCGWVDDLAGEQAKFQYYARQWARSTAADAKKKSASSASNLAAKKEEYWASPDAPRRLESLLLTNQLGSYVDQMEEFSAAGLSKLYLVGGLHAAKDASTTPSQQQ